MNKKNTIPRSDKFEFDFSLCHGNMVEETTYIKEQNEYTNVIQKVIKKCPIKRKPSVAYIKFTP